MATTQQVPRQTPAARRTGLLAAAAAALIVIVALGGLALGSTSQDVASAPEIGTVMSGYEAINDGDVDAYLALLTPEIAARDAADTQADFELWAALNHRAEVVDPCQIVEPGSQGETRVQCTVIETNDFHGAGGLTATVTEIFVLDSDGLISGRRSVSSPDKVQLASFNGSFWAWLEQAHPGVYEQIKPPIGAASGSPPGTLTGPSSALIALEYVDEFVEQSSAYPLDS